MFYDVKSFFSNRSHPIVRMSDLRISVRLHMRTDLSFESDRKFQSLSLLAKSVIRDKTSLHEFGFKKLAKSRQHPEVFPGSPPP